MNIWIDLTTLHDARGKAAWYYPQAHWTVDDNDYDFNHSALDELKTKLEKELNNFFSTQMKREDEQEKTKRENETENENQNLKQ